MKREEDSLMYPSLEHLVARIPQKYELVLTATKRAKQIIREQRLNPGSTPEEEKHIKPLTIALRDIAEGRVGKDVLLTPDVEFDDLGDTDELQNEMERMGVLPFTTRPAVDYAEPPAGASAEDFAALDDDDDDEDIEEFDDELDVELEDETPAGP